MSWGATKSSGKPQRMVRSRKKGANLQAESIALNGLYAVCVTRPGPHRNPYYPGCGLGFGGFDEQMRPVHWRLETNADMVRHFREYIRLMRRDEPERFAELIQSLRGKNIACWCKLGDPCHGDVWLELVCEPVVAVAA